MKTSFLNCYLCFCMCVYIVSCTFIYLLKDVLKRSKSFHTTRYDNSAANQRKSVLSAKTVALIVTQIHGFNVFRGIQQNL